VISAWTHGTDTVNAEIPAQRGTLLFVVNVAWFFLSHWLALARAAMAAGFAVHLASGAESDAERAQVPGCRDIVHAGENGLFVPPREARALADAIRRLLEHPELRGRMGSAGRERAKRDFGIETVVQQHLGLYQELLGSHTRAA
jgi:hypothetical protein